MANLTRRNSDQDFPSISRRGMDPLRMMREMFDWDPFREIQTLGRGDIRGGFLPDFDVIEQKDAYLFKADLPGIKEQDLDVTVSGNRLTVSGKREVEERQDEERYYAIERSYGSFTRAFTLPDDVDAAQVRADLRDGVLTLMVPKRAESQPKKIQVQKGTQPQTKH
jgi:HSP20 family protein